MSNINKWYNLHNVLNKAIKLHLTIPSHINVVQQNIARSTYYYTTAYNNNQSA